MKNVLICFGGVSAEHEVSIITGLQVLETIDREKYQPFVYYITKKGVGKFLEGMQTRKDFSVKAGTDAFLMLNSDGPQLAVPGRLGTKYIPIDSAYLAFHGGSGESGNFQGLLESLHIPFTSPSQESSVICMNKQLTKQAVIGAGVNRIPGKSVWAEDIHQDSLAVAKSLLEDMELPVIVKPVHLGSSIGISVAHNEVELEKALLESANMDNEILVEKYMQGFTEYNCAVRRIDGKLEMSEIERPLSHDEILSFADKYQRGGKKTGGDGMASLQRELPAKISSELKERIHNAAKAVFTACRCKGMVRIDFMLTREDQLLLTEVNPIPGSMSFYLWEASGISFRQQITDLLEQAERDYNDQNSKSLDYETDIVEKFVAQ